MRLLLESIAASVLISTFSLAAAQGPMSLEQVSRTQDHTLENGDSYFPVLSGDSRFVVFQSAASNLVANDNNNATDVFLYDRMLQTTERVSVDSNESELSTESEIFPHCVSDDGRYVTFVSDDPALTGSGFRQVWLRDRTAGTTTLVSKSGQGTAANQDCLGAALSGNGRFVIYYSGATNLVNIVGDTNDFDVFLYDRVLDSTACISLDAQDGSPAGHSGYGSISDDGRYVAFTSFNNLLIPNDNNPGSDVFIYDRDMATMSMISLATSGATDGNCAESRIAGNGDHVVFLSDSTNLTTNSNGSTQKLFLWSRESDSIVLVNKATGGGASDADCRSFDITDNGQSVVFSTQATNILNNPPSQLTNCYLYDTATGENVDAVRNDQDQTPNASAFNPAIAGDGSSLSFETNADNLSSDDHNNYADIYLSGLYYSNFTISGLRGQINDQAKDKRDTVQVKGVLAAKTEGGDPVTLDPATQDFNFGIYSEGGSVELQIPAGSTGWKSQSGGRFTWKSAKGVSPKATIQLNLTKMTFNISMSAFNFSAPVENAITVGLGWGNVIALSTQAWTPHKKLAGKFKL